MKGMRFPSLCTLLLLMLFLPTPSAADYAGAKKNHDAFRFEQAFPEFVRLAKQGDKRAQFYVGRMFHLGEGVAQDKSEAVRWYRKSAAQGFARAQNNLAVLYLEKGDRSEAVSLLKKAAAQGLSQARENLANFDKITTQAEPLASKRESNPGLVSPPDMGFRFNRLKPGLGVP